MTTAAIPTPTGVTNPNYGSVELLAPELWKWEKEGQELNGRFVSLETVEIKSDGEKKKVRQYIFESLTGAGSVKMIGSFDILQKLTGKYVGCKVRIIYNGTDDSVQKNGNSMKVFEVRVWPREVKSANNPEITDADIPF